LLALKPFVDWANAVLNAANGGAYVPPAGTTINFQTTIQPVWGRRSGGMFQPGAFEPTDQGFIELIATTVEQEMDASVVEASIFANTILGAVREMEQFEHWIVDPLNPSELIGMHHVLHEVLFNLAKNNDMTTDVERWREEDCLIADKILLATAYILAWQSYGVAMQFVWGLAKPWYVRLSEVVSIYMEHEDFYHVSKSLLCLKDRVHHFDNLLYSYLEGNASLEINEDMDADDDIDAVRMYHDKKVLRNNRGGVVNDDEDEADY